MTSPEPETPHTEEPAVAPASARFPWLRAVAPYAATVAVSLLLMLVVLLLWPRPETAATTLPATPTQLPVTPQPTSMPTAAPTAQPLSQGVASQEIADLHAEDNRLWTTVYLLKATNQVAEAETALRTNDMGTVDQALVAADYSLSLAYGRAEEAQKSPLDQFRRTIDRIRTDLYLYPERMDARLSQLRQLLLTVIDEPR